MPDLSQYRGWVGDVSDWLSALTASLTLRSGIAWVSVGIAGCLFLATVIVALPVGSVQPLIVTSDSMEPTYQAGDVVFVDESAPVSVGDPIVFSEQRGDQLIVHRAVDRRADGRYLTRGDAVPAQDQAAGRTAVSSAQIVGPVIQIGSVDAVVPQVGHILTLDWGTRLLIAVGIVVTAIGGQMGWDSLHQRSQSLSRETTVSLGLFSLYLGCIGAIYATVTTNLYEYTVTSSSSGTTVGTVIATGTEVSRQVIVGQAWLGPAGYTVAQSDTARTTVVSTGDSLRRIALDLPIQSSPGTLSVTLSVGTYPHVLPGGLIEFFHGIHPGVAAIMTASTVVLILVGCLHLGTRILTVQLTGRN